MACSISPMTNDVSVANDSIGGLAEVGGEGGADPLVVLLEQPLELAQLSDAACSLSISPASAPSRTRLTTAGDLRTLAHESETTSAVAGRRYGESRCPHPVVRGASSAAQPRRCRTGVSASAADCACRTARRTGRRGRRAVAPRPHRRDALGAMARRGDRRRVRALHGDVRAVSGLRAGVPERRALRPPDRGHQGHLGDGAEGRRPDAQRLAAEAARPPSSAARRVDAARRRPASAPRASAARPAPLPLRRGPRRGAHGRRPCGCSPAA